MNRLLLSASPHIRDDLNVRKIMMIVIISLIPAGAWGVYIFGLHSLWVILTGVLTAVLTELGFQKCLKHPVTVKDGSAILTGLLLAYSLPPEVPLWMPAIGSFVAIFIGKQIFGGLGHNPMNPALIGRAFLMASWPLHMTVFSTSPLGGTMSGIKSNPDVNIDGITAATPLALFKKMKEIIASQAVMPAGGENNLDTAAQWVINELNRSYLKLFFGQIGGCIGEVSAFLILLGGVYLLYRHIIGWKIPTAYLGTVIVLIALFEGLNIGHIAFHLFSGGLFLGAFYMATDMVTSPVTFKGRIIFGIGCGLLTVLIRLRGGVS
jgi:electron transport complex protein RnfD